MSIKRKLDDVVAAGSSAPPSTSNVDDAVGTQAEERSASSTPNKDIYFDRLTFVIEREGGDGRFMVSGLVKDKVSQGEEDEADDDDNDEDEEEKRENEIDYSAAELQTMRIIVSTKNRIMCLKKAAKFSDPNGGWFNTTTGNAIIEGIPKQISKAQNSKSLPKTFDALFGLTFALLQNDFWMFDNEMWGDGGNLEKCIKKLGSAWIKLLTKADEELGIDPEFTRPGIERVLEKFAAKVASCKSTAITFQWQ